MDSHSHLTDVVLNSEIERKNVTRLCVVFLRQIAGISAHLGVELHFEWRDAEESLKFRKTLFAFVKEVKSFVKPTISEFTIPSTLKLGVLSSILLQEFVTTVLCIYDNFQAELPNDNLVNWTSNDPEKRKEFSESVPVDAKEHQLIQEFLEERTGSEQLLFPFLIDFEYMTIGGKGDLLMGSSNGFLAVIEAKYIGGDSGHTARVRRTKKRKEVIEQARRYSTHVSKKHPNRLVLAACLTNEKKCLTWVDGSRLLINGLNQLAQEKQRDCLQRIGDRFGTPNSSEMFRSRQTIFFRPPTMLGMIEDDLDSFQEVMGIVSPGLSLFQIATTRGSALHPFSISSSQPKLGVKRAKPIEWE